MRLTIALYEDYNDRQFTIEENCDEQYIQASNSPEVFSKDENLAAGVALLDKLYQETRTYLLRRMSVRASALLPQVTYGGAHAKEGEGE